MPAETEPFFLKEANQGMHNGDERREFPRVPKKLQVKMTAGDSAIVSGNTRDVSLTGLFVRSDRSFPVGTLCQLVLQIESPESLVFMPAAGRVVRVEPDGMAVEFTELDEACYHYLRDLSLGHAGGPSAVEQESQDRRDRKRRMQ